MPMNEPAMSGNGEAGPRPGAAPAGLSGLQFTFLNATDIKVFRIETKQRKDRQPDDEMLR